MFCSMKRKIVVAFAAIMTLPMLTACGSSDNDSQSELESLKAENESLRAEMEPTAISTSDVTSASTSLTEITETTVGSTETIIETILETEYYDTDATVESHVESEDYRPGMYVKYVRPCAEKIGVMSQKEVETILSGVNGVENKETDSNYFYILRDETYEYTINVSKETGKVFLVAMSLQDYTFNVYIKETDSKITYMINGEYGTGVTKDFDEYVNSLEESEAFIFGDKNAYANDNKNNKETISLDEFNRLELNMKYSDVVYIIGGYGEKISESDVSGTYITMYQFEGEGSIGANAILMFENGVLTSKAQSGLE